MFTICQPCENWGKSNRVNILPPINWQHTEIAVVNEVFSKTFGLCSFFIFLFSASEATLKPNYFQLQQLMSLFRNTLNQYKPDLDLSLVSNHSRCGPLKRPIIWSLEFAWHLTIQPCTESKATQYNHDTKGHAIYCKTLWILSCPVIVKEESNQMFSFSFVKKCIKFTSKWDTLKAWECFRWSAWQIVKQHLKPPFKENWSRWLQLRWEGKTKHYQSELLEQWSNKPGLSSLSLVTTLMQDGKQWTDIDYWV